MNVFTYIIVLYVVNLKLCILIHELVLNMYIFSNILSVLILNDMIHKQHVKYILNIIKTI